MRANPRVALFTDSFLEVNGVAQTSRQLAAQAAKSDSPYLVVHAGPQTGKVAEGSLQRLSLHRTKFGFPLDVDLRFDLLFWRHAELAIQTVRQFKPDLIHLTGPSDVGLLGALIAKRLAIPVVISWHTNVHEYARTRTANFLAGLGVGPFPALGEKIESLSLDLTCLFYRIGRVLLAPNPELCEMLKLKCQRPVYLMERGVDTILFSPEKRDRQEEILNIGYVGRLSPEKNVRLLARIENDLLNSGCKSIRFTVIGSGSELEWLRNSMRTAVFTGVLRGEALAKAYADLDLFIFPSTTDTYGNVVLEAQASGVPVIVSGGGGPKYLIKKGLTGFVADCDEDFSGIVSRLYHDPNERRRMATEARRHALNLSWERIFEELYQVYREATEVHSGDDGERDGERGLRDE